MLGRDHQRATQREAQSGAGPEVLEGQQGCFICGPKPSGGLCLGDEDIAATRLSATGAGGQRGGAPVFGEEVRLPIV